MRSLASSFFMLGKIKTTEAKAKELRPLVETYLTRAKKPTLANRRLLARDFRDGVVKKIIGRADALSARSGGYTRVIKIGLRQGDGARMAFLELVV